MKCTHVCGCKRLVGAAHPQVVRRRREEAVQTLWATVMSDSFDSAGLWQGSVATGDRRGSTGPRNFKGPTDSLSPRYLFILWPNTTTGFHLQLLLRPETAGQLESQHRSGAVDITPWPSPDTSGCGEGGRLAGLLQEGPAAPHALLVHGLEVRVIAVVRVLDNKSFFRIIAPK